MVNWAIIFLFAAGAVFIIVKMKEHEEPYYALKIIGYYLLGVFTFTFNKIHIPLGFIIFLLFLRHPEKNRRGKRWAAVLGLVVFLISFMIPFIAESYYERTHYIEPEITNVYDFNFYNHWERVAETLELDEHSIMTAKAEDLKIDYEKDGEIKTFRYELTWRDQGQLCHAYVNFYEGKKKIAVKSTKVEEWLQYGRLIEAERLFNKLDRIDMEDLTPEVDFSYYGLILPGEYSNFAIKDGDIFIIEDNRVIPYSSELPIEGYWLTTFGMKQTGDNSYSSSNNRYYLFNVQYNK